MYARERAIVTVIIWIMMAIMFDSAVVHGSSGDVIPLAALLGAAASAATYAIWNASLGGTQAQPEQSEKAKRVEQTRVSRMLASLDEDELEELRARLETRGDPITLDDLLESDDHASYEA